MRRMVILATLSVLAVFASVGARADVGLPGVFGDGMVLQCQAKCPVWGTAGAGEQVTVIFRDRTATATAKDGVWRVDVDADEAGGPFVLTVQGTNRIEVPNVYVGEVWVVAGQSNAAQAAVFDAPKDDPDGVRFHLTAELAAKDGGTRWVTGGRVAMLGWHFGREMRLRHKVPIGIISCAWGGTSIEQWKPGPDPTVKQAGPGGALGEAGGLYDKWVVPLQPYRLKGVVWWQGESNVNNATEYLTKFTSLVNVWRQAWGQPDLPFVWVQLQRIVHTGPTWWLKIADGRSAIADAQRRALALPNTAMAVAYDITEGDLHPNNVEKQLIAGRLALAADGVAYASQAEYSGPLPDKATRNGDTVVVTFTHAMGGLKVRDNLTVKATDVRGFELQSAGGESVPVQGRIDGSSVVLPAPGLKPPLVVRYAWGPQPAANLYTAADLPVPTFQFDPVE